MRFRVQSIQRWLHLNEYEGLVEGLVDGQLLGAHLMLHGDGAWSSWVPGAEMDVELWLERAGEVQVLPGAKIAAMRRIGETSYEIIGPVRDILDDETLVVGVEVALRVDLDPPVAGGSQLPPIGHGDWIRVSGTLKLASAEDDERQS